MLSFIHLYFYVDGIDAQQIQYYVEHTFLTRTTTEKSRTVACKRTTQC